ncbi:hypothetical protein [Nitratireductor sp.]|uniref:hypothetical protein n=1 Tax=Nitratireductor sp. TaxID=1872084 RepID=UPI00261A0F38|nr:hypothetical protein [Nitratireductor sp.]MCV0381736.1 hypothetical protein [Nitratireductor sp.]
MQSIRLEFTAAAGKKRYAGIGFIWLMIWAIAILDDSDRRTRKAEQAAAQAHAQSRNRHPGM